MGNLHINKAQIEICNIILKNNNKTIMSIGALSSYENIDKVISLRLLKEYYLISNVDPILLTDLGIRYSNKGIVKFIKKKRTDELLTSPKFKTIWLIIPIIISLLFNIFNYCQNQKIKLDNNEYIRKQDIDSTLYRHR